jgi:hypothetical protein
LSVNVEWWREGLSPDNTIRAWATAATTSVILAVLLEERVMENKGVLPPREQTGRDEGA